jgi:hypothetical protein
LAIVLQSLGSAPVTPPDTPVSDCGEWASQTKDLSGCQSIEEVGCIFGVENLHESEEKIKKAVSGSFTELKQL